MRESFLRDKKIGRFGFAWLTVAECGGCVVLTAT